MYLYLAVYYNRFEISGKFIEQILKMNKETIFESSLWVNDSDKSYIEVVDQRYLPFEAKTFRIETVGAACFAIAEMVVRGAPLIGVTAAFGMYLAAFECNGSDLKTCLGKAEKALNATRPTAVNLFAATKRMMDVFRKTEPGEDAVPVLWREAGRIRDEEIDRSYRIGMHGLPLIESIWKQKGDTVNILTHCNAGWLACIKWGTATAPVYLANQKGIPIHVWIDETRPRNQGARLTAYELAQAGVRHTIIPDNTGGHIMQQNRVDLVITGSDRITANGDVANKIGTYLKALAAADNHIPFYAALPSSTIDWQLADGKDIPVEIRNSDETAFMEGWNGHKIEKIRIYPENSPTVNYGFDVTPARLVTGLITERGICKANRESIRNLFPDKFL